MIDFEDMRYLVEVLEQGGFNRAAERLGVSKSLVSRRISAMEAHLGVRLINRSTRGINPTDAGLEFRSHADRILASFNDAREAVVRESGEMVGRLRISAPLSFGVRHVAPVLSAMAERHPRLEIDASFSDRVVDIVGERFDAAVRIGELRDSSLVARRVASVGARLVASPAYLDRRGRPLLPTDLVRHECLIYSGMVSPDWKMRAGKRVVAVRPNGRLRSDSGEVLLQWAVAGLGIVNTPSFLIGSELEDGRLETILDEYSASDIGVYVVRPPGTAVPAKVRRLIDELVAHFQAERL
jgi:DNA-binding transcriptional LysR family regulator